MHRRSSQVRRYQLPLQPQHGAHSRRTSRPDATRGFRRWVAPRYVAGVFRRGTRASEPRYGDLRVGDRENEVERDFLRVAVRSQVSRGPGCRTLIRGGSGPGACLRGGKWLRPSPGQLDLRCAGEDRFSRLLRWRRNFGGQSDSCLLVEAGTNERVGGGTTAESVPSWRKEPVSQGDSLSIGRGLRSIAWSGASQS